MRELSDQERLKFELSGFENWTLFYVDSDEIVYCHTQRDHHYVRVARAIERDHSWYGLLHIGRLSPVDDRYTGADRRPFDSYEDASAWSYDYLTNHPDGVDPNDIRETQMDYK